MIKKLPKSCFECESATEDNYKLFIVNNTIVFPDNILSVEDYAFDDIADQIHFVYGKNVQIIGEYVFYNSKSLRIARFPSLLEM